MLKIRLMGTKKDIHWFAKIMEECEDIRINERSTIYENKGTNNYYRAYLEVEDSKKTKE